MSSADKVPLFRQIGVIQRRIVDHLDMVERVVKETQYAERLAPEVERDRLDAEAAVRTLQLIADHEPAVVRAIRADRKSSPEG